MKLTITKYGRPQTIIFSAISITLMAACLIVGPMFLPPWAVWLIEVLLAIDLIGAMAFFRDPARSVPQDNNLLLAPADGTIADIETIEEDDFFNQPVLRIGIFLSVFNVHINRAPCSAKVEKITYKKGSFKDARHPHAGRLNESNSVYLTRTDSPADRLMVRQISGAIARRIVCAAKPGQNLAGGEKFGMIKFGSRTELYLPARENAKCLVKVGDKVRAGLSGLVRYEE